MNASPPTLGRSVGRFFGHILQAIRAKPSAERTMVVRRSTEEAQAGELRLRRTTIDELVLDQSTSEPPSPSESKSPPPCP